MSKKILVVSQHFWPESFRINDICDGFVENGYQVEVLCGIPNYPTGHFYPGYGITKKRFQKRKGMKIRRCFEIKRGSNTNLRIFLNYISFPISSVFHLPYLMKQKYDKIFIFQTSPVIMSLTGILLGKIKKIETTMYVLDLWPENLYSVLNVKSKILRGIAYIVSTWHYRQVDKIVANSRKLQWLLKKRVKIDDKKIMFMPQFCEKIYEETIVDESIQIWFEDTFNLVFTGNISPAQSFETVIEAAKMLKEKGLDKIMWIVVGDGMSRNWLEEQVRKEGLTASFTFIGQVPMEEVPKYTRVANGLFACLSKSEMLDAALPAKIFSYYAAGKPLVLAMDGEIQSMVKESKAGYIVPAEDSRGLAEAVLKLYQADKEECQQMGENAKDYYDKHFERNMNMEKLIRFMFEDKK